MAAKPELILGWPLMMNKDPVTGGQFLIVDINSMPVVTVAQGTGTSNVSVLSIAAGNNNIGNVDIASFMGMLPSGSNNLGYVGIFAGEAHMGEIGGHANKSTVEITLVTGTTPYGANDVVGGNGGLTIFELTNVGRQIGETQYLVGVRVVTNQKSITPRFRLHFFNANTPTISADNANWQDKYADKDLRTGYIDLPAMTTAADTTNSDMSRAMDMTLRVLMKCAAASTSLWVAVETLDAFTPTSAQKIYIITLWDNN